VPRRHTERFPEGTLAVWDDDHLVFLDLRSPRTMRNIASNPAMEVNVVDPILRKAYREWPL